MKNVKPERECFIKTLHPEQTEWEVQIETFINKIRKPFTDINEDDAWIDLIETKIDGQGFVNILKIENYEKDKK